MKKRLVLLMALSLTFAFPAAVMAEVLSMNEKGGMTVYGRKH